MASRFLDRYYVCNVLLILAYVALRVQRLDPGELGEVDILGFTRETSIYFCAGLLFFVRMLSAPTMDAYLATCFKVSFVAVSLLLWFMDVRVMRVFGGLYAAVFVLCPQPRFRYPDSIAALNHASFDARVVNNPHRTFTVVWAHATWSPRCTQLAPVFADLAKMIDHPRVRFAKIDVGRWATAAAKLRVSVAATSNEIPVRRLFRPPARGSRASRPP